MVTKIEPNVLHLTQASLQFTDGPKQRASDLNDDLSRGAAVVHFTEAGHAHAEIRAVAAEHAYRVVWPKQGDSVFAVAKEVTLLDHDSRPVLPADPRPPSQGGHDARPIAWVSIMVGRNLAFVHGAHWITGLREGGSRLALHRLQTREMARIATQHADGRAVSFWMGDTNVDDAKSTPAYDVLMDEAGLISVWDQRRRWPATHGGPRSGTIDVIGSLDKDKRVSLVKAEVHPRGFSDHSAVSAWFRIAP